jgi:hypothetical protein
MTMCPVQWVVDDTAPTAWLSVVGEVMTGRVVMLTGLYMPDRGSGRYASCVGPAVRIPGAERRFPLIVQDARARLQ